MNLPTTSAASAPPASAVRRCPLCDAPDGAAGVRFRQRYDQSGGEPVWLTWSACRHCRGWFADPMPTRQQIARHWQRVDYADPGHAGVIGDRKIPLFTRVLEGLERRVRPGSLLDIGCNFGRFLTMAQARGWKPVGFEPNEDAAKRCRAAGFDVRTGWEVEECGFADEGFDAVTAVDVFCCSLHPFRDLLAYRRLLRPGGVLAMRLTNKHAVLRAVDALLPSASRRDRLISKLLLGQFHSASPGTVRRWLAQAGFVEPAIEGRAMACPWREARWRSRLAYGGTDLLRAVTLNAVNLSPGLLVFARRPQ
jgi:SAM-dependent methyltransferase